LTVKLIVDDV